MYMIKINVKNLTYFLVVIKTIPRNVNSSHEFALPAFSTADRILKSINSNFTDTCLRL